MTGTVIVIDSDGVEAKARVAALRRDGFAVSHVGREDGHLPSRHPEDIIVIDCAVQDAALRILDSIRADKSLHILVLLRSGSEADHLKTFRQGADDVLASSVSTRLLGARLDALLRRRSDAGAPTPQVLTHGSLTLHPGLRQISVHGILVRTTRTEFDIVAILMANPHRVVHRKEILASVWGPWYDQPSLVEVHLSRVRSKVTRAGGPRIGEPVPGVGYRLGPTDDPTASRLVREPVAAHA